MVGPGPAARARNEDYEWWKERPEIQEAYPNWLNESRGAEVSKDRGLEPERDMGEMSSIGRLANKSVDPYAMDYRYRKSDNMMMLQDEYQRHVQQNQYAQPQTSDHYFGTKEERAAVGQGQFSGYQGPYNYPELDDHTMKYLAGYKNAKNGHQSQLWSSNLKRNGGIGKRTKFHKWSGKKQLWQTLRTQREANRFLSRGQRKPGVWNPVNIPPGTKMNQYLRDIRNVLGHTYQNMYMGGGGHNPNLQQAFGVGGAAYLQGNNYQLGGGGLQTPNIFQQGGGGGYGNP